MTSDLDRTIIACLAERVRSLEAENDALKASHSIDALPRASQSIDAPLTDKPKTADAEKLKTVTENYRVYKRKYSDPSYRPPANSQGRLHLGTVSTLREAVECYNKVANLHDCSTLPQPTHEPVTNTRYKKVTVDGYKNIRSLPARRGIKNRGGEIKNRFEVSFTLPSRKMRPPESEPTPTTSPTRMPIWEMKAALVAAGLDASRCVERHEVEALYDTISR